MGIAAEKIKALGKFSTATLCEALGWFGNLPSAIKPIGRGMKVCGPAYTVSTMPRDNVLLHRAYAYAKPGDVLLVDCNGYYEAGYWGDLMSLGAKTRGIAGLVIDGCIRDTDDIEAMGFAVFARGSCIHGTTNHGTGTLNEAIIIGNCPVAPGDIVVGDRDGVVIVPQGRIDEALTKAHAREEKEAATRTQLKAGKTSLEIYGWK